MKKLPASIPQITILFPSPGLVGAGPEPRQDNRLPDLLHDDRGRGPRRVEEEDRRPHRIRRSPQPREVRHVRRGRGSALQEQPGPAERQGHGQGLARGRAPEPPCPRGLDPLDDPVLVAAHQAQPGQLQGQLRRGQGVRRLAGHDPDPERTQDHHHPRLPDDADDRQRPPAVHDVQRQCECCAAGRPVQAALEDHRDHADGCAQAHGWARVLRGRQWRGDSGELSPRLN